METQADYETEPIVAVFRSADEARAGVDRLRALGIATHATAHVPCAAGRFQLEDGSLREEGDGLWKGALLGAPIGALFGIALSVSVPSPGVGVVAGLAAGGALGCGILGGLVGAIVRARFDDDEAEWIDVPAGSSLELVVAFTRRPRRTRQVLLAAGATALLDCTMPEAAEIVRACGAQPSQEDSSAQVPAARPAS
jgi:hypothetical protein